MKTVVVIGGTGAQGSAIVRHLSATDKFKVLALTRSLTSAAARDLAGLPHVELVEMRAVVGYDLDAFSDAARRADHAFVNTDGFALGEQAETYWGVRLFETAVRAGVQHFVYSGLDYNGKKAGYDPDLYVGHYEGKARVQEFIRAQPTTPTAWTVINSGPYMEMLHDRLRPEKGSDDVVRFKFPLADGAVPFIHLDDFARYVAWIFETPRRSNGMVLQIATAHVSGEELARSFTAVTNRRAEYVDVPTPDWVEAMWGHLPFGSDTKVGAQTIKDPDALPQTFGQNFTNWWNLYKASADNKGLIQRDYGLLDDILPDRVKSAEEWMAKVGYDATPKQVIRSGRGVAPKAREG